MNLRNTAILASITAVLALGGGCASEAAKLSYEAKAATAEELRDPSSAIFSNVTVRGAEVCGEVNGKNGYGGYAGKTRFTYHRLIGVTLQPEENEFPLLSPQASRQSYCVFDQEYRQCKGETFDTSPLEACSALRVPAA